MRRELISFRDHDLIQVGEHEISSLWDRILEMIFSISANPSNHKVVTPCRTVDQLTGIPNSSQTAQNLLIFPNISARLSPQNPFFSACPRLIATASCNGLTLL